MMLTTIIKEKFKRKTYIYMSNQTSDNNKRIAKNTLFLYFRMLFMMGKCCKCSVKAVLCA